MGHIPRAVYLKHFRVDRLLFSLIQGCFQYQGNTKMLLLLHTAQANLQEQTAEPGDFKKLFKQKAWFISWNQYQRLPLSRRAHRGSCTQATESKTISSEGMKRQNTRFSAARSQMITPRPISVFLVFCILRFPLFSGTPITALRHEHLGISFGSV